MTPCLTMCLPKRRWGMPTPNSPEDEFLCDKEVCQLLGISMSCLRSILAEGPSRGGIDLRKANPIKVNSMRRWSRNRLCELVGIKR